MSFNQIIEGTINNILNKRDELYNERIKKMTDFTIMNEKEVL